MIAIDARGHGDSEKPDSYTLEDHVNDVIGHLSFEEKMSKLATQFFHNMEPVGAWLESIPGGRPSL